MRGVCTLLAVFLLAVVPVSAQRGAARQQLDAAPSCDVTTPLTAVAGLVEGSGLALSRRLPRRLFTINDSAAPEVFVLDVDGTSRGRVAIKGAMVTDWEDITSGPCPGGACLYIADIGDNAHVRARISLYRVLEPKDTDREATAMRFDAVYSDGPHDAEAMFSGPDGRLYLLTKEARGSRLYAFPHRLDDTMPNRLEAVATLDFGTGRGRFARVTDAETSEDGRTAAVRTNDTLFILPTTSLLAGRLADAAVFSLRALGEPQGEGVALGASGEVFVAGEAGGRRATGTFARLTCAAPR